MKTLFTNRHFHTDARLWVAVLLTLWALLFPTRLYADDKTAMTPEPLIATRPIYSSFESADRSYRLGLLMNYVRHEGPALMPGLPDEMRAPAHFAMEQLRSARDTLGLNDGDPDDGFLSPVFSLMQAPDDSIAESLWLTPGYHHLHGMLPFDDALTIGFNYRNSVLDHRVKFEVHPFYAQSWHSSEGYWGTEMTFNVGPATGQSWGKISLRYDNGNSDLMDHKHGLDMHAEFLFDHNLTLTAGAQSNEASDLGNYVLLRWRLVGGD